MPSLLVDRLLSSLGLSLTELTLEPLGQLGHNFIQISDNAVIGIPDEVIGQKIKAVIVRKENSTISGDEIIEYCKKNMEPFAVPEIIQFQASIPKTAHGKTDKLKMKNQE